MELAQLERSLLAFEPADLTESGYRREMLELVASPGCCQRAHFVPGHFTASSFVLAPDAEELLLIFHGKLERWLQPGGHIEPSDGSILEAACRELQEEAGLTDLVPIGEIFDVDVHDIPGLQGDPPHKHFDLRFLFRARTRALRVGSDAKDARWVPLAQVNEIESDASVMRAVRKILALSSA